MNWKSQTLEQVLVGLDPWLIPFKIKNHLFDICRDKFKYIFNSLSLFQMLNKSIR